MRTYGMQMRRSDWLSLVFQGLTKQRRCISMHLVSTGLTLLPSSVPQYSFSYGTRIYVGAALPLLIHGSYGMHLKLNQW